MSNRPRPPRAPADAPPPAPFGDRLADFAPLSPAEMKLREACRTGDVAVYGDERPEEKSEERRLRAAVVRVFCLGRDPAAPVHVHGVQIMGAWIDGALDLAGVSVPHPLLCVQCRFDGSITLYDATTRQLIFSKSSCPGITADRLVTHGGLFLRALHTAGTVRLMGATIGGNLDCSGTTFAEGEGDALACDGAEIAGSVFLKDKFTAHREVRFTGATIGGDLDCTGAIFAEGKGHALACDGVEVSGAVFLTDGFTAHREVRFLNATIGDELNCTGAIFAAGKGDALACDRAEIAGSVFLKGKFIAHREVRFLGATVGGDFSCNGATFAEGKGHGLACDGAEITGSVFLSDNFTAHRELRFVGATIGGDFGCRWCRFEASAPLTLDKATITGTLFLYAGFHSRSRVDLSSATIGDLVDTPAAWEDATYVLDGLTYRRFAGDVPSAEASARIRWLDRQPPEHLSGPDFRPQPWEQCAKVLAEMGHEADAVRIRIEKRRRMRPLPLHRVRTGEKKQHVRDAFAELLRHPGRVALRAVPTTLAGYGGALAGQGLVRLGMVGDFLLCLTVGYGWRPQWAIGWLLALWIGTANLYAYAVPRGVMAPTDALVYLSRSIPAECRLDWLTFEPRLRENHDAAQIAAAHASGAPFETGENGVTIVPEWSAICPRLMPSEYTTFSPWVYALDLLLPIVDLRQEKDWSPRVTDAEGAVIAPLWPGSDWGWGYLTRLMEWAMIGLGWGLSGMLLGAVTGVIRRE